MIRYAKYMFNYGNAMWEETWSYYQSDEEFKKAYPKAKYFERMVETEIETISKRN